MSLYQRRCALGHAAAALVREGALRSFNRGAKGVYVARFHGSKTLALHGLREAEHFIENMTGRTSL